MSDTVLPSLRFSVETGPHTGVEFCSATHVVSVGRGADNDLCLCDDQTVSEFHARLYVENGYWYVADSGSRNGIFVAEPEGLKRLSEPMLLSDEHQIHLGACQITLSLVPCTAPTVASPPPSSEFPVINLQIRHEPGKISFGFGGNAPLSSLYTTDYSPELVAGTIRRLEDVMQLANLDPDHAALATTEFQELGEQLTRQLVPERVLEKMAALDPCALQITHDSELLHVPWELARLNGVPWCECLNLGRQMVLEHVSRQIVPPGIHKRPSLLIAVNPTGDLDEAQAEGEILLRQLSPHENWLDIVLLAGSRITVERLLGEMDQADIVYYLGHGHYDATAPERSGWLLSDGPLSTAHMHKLRRPPKVVFSNACDSARESVQTKATHGYAENIGMASKFLFAGVEAYVGSLWPIHVESGAYFARVFFRHLLEGDVIGAAVRKARQEMHQACGDTDWAWASYILYGDPNGRLKKTKN